MPSAKKQKMLHLIKSKKQDPATEASAGETTLEVTPPTPATEAAKATPEAATPEAATPEAKSPALEKKPIPPAPEKSKAEEAAPTPPESHKTPAETKHTQEDEAGENSIFFQAIGTLYGIVTPHPEGGFAITVGSNEYRLYFPSKFRYVGFLKQRENYPDTPLYLRVYPKCQLIPRQPPRIYFQVFAWNTENEWQQEPNQFILSGIWQFIPQNRSPVISIYRNRQASDPTEKFKASHIPVLMRREGEVQPFKFNPKTPKDKLPKRWFIQGIFKFLPNRNSFGWSEDISEPTDAIPRYKKPVKAPGTNTKPPAKDKPRSSSFNSEKPMRKAGQRPIKPTKKAE
ncbi:hypothetical protein K4A83_11745 [Spirulina subsalsa FACHB-351]|uniref:Uncharacterized protein n=1 Tax=Spirulina subsalsa FACHB-351 TaxID=234711 RepID=A0ABT3L5Y9_9CYAN|nr:hypothetical protein [Spirulina subsalsa]MCW6036931.1 hypothetical protein [Spirulina subsalsa FACHB-351]